MLKWNNKKPSTKSFLKTVVLANIEPPTECLKQKAEAEAMSEDQMGGVFIPSCELNGDFSPLQQDASSGQSFEKIDSLMSK